MRRVCDWCRRVEWENLEHLEQPSFSSYGSPRFPFAGDGSPFEILFRIPFRCCSEVPNMGSSLRFPDVMWNL